MKQQGLITSNFHFPYNPNMKERAREMRKNSTPGELRLWCEVLQHKRTGFTFYRQRTIENYIADFYCAKLKLAIEVDGSSHRNKEEYDNKRTEDLEYWGIQVVRFKEDEVMNRLKTVKNKIQEVLKQRANEMNKKD